MRRFVHIYASGKRGCHCMVDIHTASQGQETDQVATVLVIVECAADVTGIAVWGSLATQTLGRAPS